MANSSLSFDMDEILQNADEFEDRLKYAVKMYAITKASELEAKMKTNRKWTDRTGMAKARLKAEVSEPDENTIRITLSHGVDYGIWLELANEKNFAIIQPTLNLESPKVLQGLDGLLNKVKM